MQGIGFAIVAMLARLVGRTKPEPDEMATPARDVRPDELVKEARRDGADDDHG